VEVRPQPQRAGGGSAEFIGSDPQVLTTDLLFDAFEGSSRSVVKAWTG
jgi:hypothetical protein